MQVKKAPAIVETDDIKIPSTASAMKHLDEEIHARDKVVLCPECHELNCPVTVVLTEAARAKK